MPPQMYPGQPGQVPMQMQAMPTQVPMLQMQQAPMQPMQTAPLTISHDGSVLPQVF